MSYNQVVGSQNPNVWIRGEVANTNSGSSAYTINYGGGIVYGTEGITDNGMSYPGGAATSFDLTSTTNQNFTISGWWKPVDGGNSDFMRQILLIDANYYESITVDSNGIVWYRAADGTSYTTSTIKLNTWNHIAIRANADDPIGGGVDIFINGVLTNIPGGSTNNYIYDGARFNLGRVYATGGNNAGYDEMAFWRRSLTDAEILAQYNSSYQAVILSQSVSEYLPYGTGRNAAPGGTDWVTGSTQSSTAAVGLFGRAIVGNGQSTDTIRKGRTGGVTSHTLWMKTTQTSGFLFQFRNTAGSTAWALYFVNGVLRFGSTVQTGTRGNAITAINDNKWHHVALVIQQTNNTDRLKIYVDGVEEFTGNIASPTSASATVDIVSRDVIASNTGATLATAPHYVGLIDEFAGFDRALTAQEISDQYAARPQDYTPPTVVNAKVTATPATSNFAGTANNSAYQYMDTTSVSGYRQKVLSLGSVLYYTDGLSGTNLGSVGGAFTTNNGTYQSQGKYTGGIALGTSSPATKGSVNFSYGTTKTMVHSFWFKLSPVMYTRQIWSRRSTSSVASIVEQLSVNMDGKLYYNGSMTPVRDIVVADGKWHHVVLNPGLSPIYLDAVAGPNRTNLTAATSYVAISSNDPIDGLAMVGSVVSFDEFWVADLTALSLAQVQSLYNYSETRQKANPATFGFFGTTNNNVNNVTNVKVTGGNVTIGMNGTNNNTARAPQRVLAPAATASFLGRDANVTAVRLFKFTTTPGTMSFTGTNGNRGYTPMAAIKAEPAYATFQGVNANVYVAKSAKVTVPVGTFSLAGTNGNVTKTRTDRTVTTNAGTVLIRAQGAKLKVNGEYVDNFNNFNRWYQQIRATHIVKNPVFTVKEDYKLGTNLQWYKFEGTEPPFLAPEGANGASTGTVQVVGDYQMGVDAGHTRNGIKLRNGGYFQSRTTYPFIIPGAQQQLLGGLRTHYTAEFAFRAYGPGAICSGVRINAAGKLEFLQPNGYWYELRTDYGNLLDGQYHHMVFISPQAYFVPPESNPDRNFVVLDGKVVSAVHAPIYVPNTWGYDAVTGANSQIDFDDIIIDMFRIISTTEAAKLYYEYSEAVIIGNVQVARALFAGTANNKPKGNVLRVLALYGSPAGYTTRGDEIFKYMNEYSSFKISNGSEAQNSPSGFQNDGGRGGTFRYNNMLVFPVSYTAKNASAAGIIDTNRATYVDDKTGYTRLIDFDNDFAVDPADFDIVTVVRWPSMQDSLVTRPFLTYTPGTGGGYLGNQAPPSEPNDILLARRNTIEKFSQGILKLANKGVHVWVQDPATALGLGLITGYTDDQPRLTERTEDDGVLNQGARATELKYGRQPSIGTLGSPGYADTGHNVWKRRITAFLPGLSDVPTWGTIDSVEWRDLNPFAAHAVQYRRKYEYFAQTAIGDEFAVVSDGNTGIEYYYTKGFVSADPTGFVGTPVSKGQALISTKAGTFASNPYSERIMTLAVEAGTTVKGITINARIFAEFNEKLSQPYVLMGNSKDYINGRPLLPNEQPNQWDYDSTRENQIVANYALERFRNNLYIGAEAQPYIVYGNGVPTEIYGAIDMHTRGINWLKAYVAPNFGDTRVKADAGQVVLNGTSASNAKPTRNARVRSEAARARFEFTMPKNFQNTNPRVTSFPATVAFAGIDIQAIVKANVGTIVITAPNTKTSGEGQDLVLYYSNWEPALYKEDI